MSTDTDEAAEIIARLLTYLSPWELETLNGARRAVAWLKKIDHPDLSLPVSVRDIMNKS